MDVAAAQRAGQIVEKILRAQTGQPLPERPATHGPQNQERGGRHHRRDRHRGRRGNRDFRGVPGQVLPQPGLPAGAAPAAILPQQTPEAGETGAPALEVEPEQRPQAPRPQEQRPERLPRPPAPPVRKVVLLNSTEPGEIRVAILENGELAEIFMERKSRTQQAGNIYKGRVVNIEPSLQAAFVELGGERNGFLHASDCIPPHGGYSDILNQPRPQGQAQNQPHPNVAPMTAGTQPSAPEEPGQPQPGPSLPPQGGAPAGQPQNSSNHRRRRRRGGRGRSGRARVNPPTSPMVAPADANDPASFFQDEPENAGGMTPGSDRDAAAAQAPVAGSERSDKVGAPSAAPVAEDSSPVAAAQNPNESAHGPLAPEPAAASSDENSPQEPVGENSPAAPDSEMEAPAPWETEAEARVRANIAENSESQVPAEAGASEPDDSNVAAQSAQPEARTERASEQSVEEQEGGRALSVAPIPAPGQPAPVLAQQRHHRQRNGRERPHDRRYTIQEMLREGQDVLIQVAKEGMGQKGPALTTYLSIPGRYLVLMPAVQRLGVSKRIESEEQRRTLKEALAEINPPEDMGVIVRTAGMGRSKEELQRDMNYLMRIWDTLKKKAKIAKSPALIFQEGDVVTRVFRDIITDDVAEIIIDDPIVMERAREFLRETSPGSEHKLKLYSEELPLFHKHGVEQQIQRLFNRKVTLRNGGSIVIEQTEALVAIDVNTGRYREKRNQDDTILQTNLEAAREIARQLRLRDIGGLVMIDFIDMEIGEHRRRVERELRAHLNRDKARINVLPISTLGVVEMTRQRVRHSLRKTMFDRCPHCSGSGHIKSAETIGLEMLREIKSQLIDAAVRRVKVLLNSGVAFEILNQFRRELVRLEETKGVTVTVSGDPAVPISQMQVSIAKEGGEWVLRKVSEVDDYVRNS